jgi:TolB-like protein/Tfp pilus assembly protein PilF
MSDTPTTDAKRAVFVSYAREDTAPAQRIADALRSHGVEVWFDRDELRGGDTWDQKIRRQIKECALFVPVVSAHTQERSEGYFRLEWKLAVERTHLMLEGVPFLAPVVVDDTAESGAAVPAEFMKVQWTRLPGALPTPQFVEQIKRLLEAPRKNPAAKKSSSVAPQLQAAPPAAKSGFPVGIVAALGVVVLGLVAFIAFRPKAETVGGALRPDRSAAMAELEPKAPPTSPSTPSVNDKSIAVLPFVDMSQAKDQEYFSDGLSEELLNLLAKIPALSVTSRSSAFSYKGKDVKLAQVARELGVAHILEGSVRKSGNRLRITAQLIDARTDKHIWSETYDRSLDDIFAVQDDIAGAVVSQLKVTLLGAAPKAKATNPKAYTLYLQARQLRLQSTPQSDVQAMALYNEALAIDPKLASAWTEIASCQLHLADVSGRPAEGLELAREAVDKALAIDPDFAGAYVLLANLVFKTPGGDLPTMARHLERALALDPANTETMASALGVLILLKRSEEAVAFGEYVVAHNPVDSGPHLALAAAYSCAGRRDEAIGSYQNALRLRPGWPFLHYKLGTELLRNRDAKAALAEYLQAARSWRLIGLTMAYHALGQKVDSDAALTECISQYEKVSAWNIAYALAYRGEVDRAFDWLDKAIASQDFGLGESALTPEFTSLHADPRWLPFLRKIGRAPEQVALVKFNPKLPGK